MDKLTKEQRSLNMSKIGSKNTKPELMLFKLLKEQGLKFKKHYNTSGKPDAVFVKEKIAVFLNGEFWHGRFYDEIKDKLPEFWQVKISANIERDKRNYKLLKKDGWKVIIIWDKDLKKNPEKEIGKILRAVKQRILPEIVLN